MRATAHVAFPGLASAPRTASSRRGPVRVMANREQLNSATSQGLALSGSVMALNGGLAKFAVRDDVSVSRTEESGKTTVTIKARLPHNAPPGPSTCWGRVPARLTAGGHGVTPPRRGVPTATGSTRCGRASGLGSSAVGVPNCSLRLCPWILGALPRGRAAHACTSAASGEHCHACPCGRADCRPTRLAARWVAVSFWALLWGLPVLSPCL